MTCRLVNNKLLLVVSTTLLVSGPTALVTLHPEILAQSQSQTPLAARNPVFVTPEQLSVASILEPPASPESPKTLEELEELHRLQVTRTPDQIRQAQDDDREESIFAFASVMGTRFNRAVLPLTAVLSDHVRINERIIVNPAKNFFRRPRPYQLDPTIHPVCRTTINQQDTSYPSGHGTTGYLEALVLVQLVPEKRDAILSRADDYAHNREVCGVHYRSDEVASRTVAYAMIGFMMKNPQFQEELAAARAEVRGQLGLGPIHTRRQ